MGVAGSRGDWSWGCQSKSNNGEADPQPRHTERGTGNVALTSVVVVVLFPVFVSACP